MLDGRTGKADLSMRSHSWAIKTRMDGIILGERVVTRSEGSFTAYYRFGLRYSRGAHWRNLSHTCVYQSELALGIVGEYVTRKHQVARRVEDELS